MSDIKALEWEEVHQARSLEDPNTELQGWEAMTGFGCGYYIEIRDGRFRLTDHLYGETTFEDPDEAKAAAQSDYEARIRSALVERKAEPVACEWRHGAPQKPWSDEWFIAETTYGYRVVLRSLPEDWTYDFKTADDTYIKAGKIKRWMQFPDSHYVTPTAAPVRGDGWQTIDTAPKGRKLVLLDCEDWLNPVIGYFSETIGSWLEYGTRDTKANAATHWVHLPDRAALSASPSPVDSRDGLIFPRELTDDLRDVLSTMLWTSGQIAHCLRAGGEDIKTRAEDEQSHVLHWLLCLALEHGPAWREKASDRISEIRAALAAKEQQP